jgi:zinc protease
MRSLKRWWIVLFLGAAVGASPPLPKLFNALERPLANGIKAYFIQKTGSPVVSVIVGYKVGGADDPRGSSGLAHALEHMMFKGPDASPSASLMGFVESEGGIINAHTTSDITLYYEVVLKEHFAKVCAIEASRMGNLEIVPQQLTSEIQVILEEMGMRIKNNPLASFYQNLDLLIYKHHPYRIPVIGWEDEVKSYTPDDLKTFHRRFYHPANAVIVVVGDLPVEDMFKELDKTFGVLPAGGPLERKRVSEPPIKIESRFEETSDKVNQPFVALSWKGPSYRQNKVDRVALSVLQSVLTASSNSLLYEEMVELKKVAVGITLAYDPLTVDDQDLRIIAQVSSQSTPQALEKAILEALHHFRRQGISAQAVAAAKTRLLAGLPYLRDSLMSGGDHLASLLCVGASLEDVETLPAQIQAVTVEDVNRLLKIYLQGVPQVVGYLKPLHPGKSSPKPVSLNPTRIH